MFTIKANSLSLSLALSHTRSLSRTLSIFFPPTNRLLQRQTSIVSKLKIVNDVCFFRGKERTTHVQKLPFSLSQMILIIISQDNFPSFHLKKRQVQSFLKAYKVKGKKIAHEKFTQKMIFFQVWQRLRSGSSAEERNPGVDGHPEGLAERAQEESVSNQRRKNHACHHHQDDPHPGQLSSLF